MGWGGFEPTLELTLLASLRGVNSNEARRSLLAALVAPRLTADLLGTCLLASLRGRASESGEGDCESR